MSTIMVTGDELAVYDSRCEARIDAAALDAELVEILVLDALLVEAFFGRPPVACP